MPPAERSTCDGGAGIVAHTIRNMHGIPFRLSKYRPEGGEICGFYANETPHQSSCCTAQKSERKEVHRCGEVRYRAHHRNSAAQNEICADLMFPKHGGIDQQD